MTRTKAIAVIAAVLGLVAIGALVIRGQQGCGNETEASGCTRVLFIGNSYTYVNDLPAMFAQLAQSGGHRVETGMVAVGGSTLGEHAASVATAAKLTSARWDLVVLQEQSQIPSVDQLRQSEMYPAARRLADTIYRHGGRPIFFLTWAHRDGWPENGLPDYASMQSAIDQGYLTIAAEEEAAVAPVGVAWASVLSQAHPALWQDDGSHPTTAGTYLAACVFYATVFHQSPRGLAYHADLSAADAAILQTVAADTVLDDPGKWGSAALRPASWTGDASQPAPDSTRGSSPIGQFASRRTHT